MVNRCIIIRTSTLPQVSSGSFHNTEDTVANVSPTESKSVKQVPPLQYNSAGKFLGIDLLDSKQQGYRGLAAIFTSLSCYQYLRNLVQLCAQYFADAGLFVSTALLEIIPKMPGRRSIRQVL
jgi:hypothetical protein